MTTFAMTVFRMESHTDCRSYTFSEEAESSAAHLDAVGCLLGLVHAYLAWRKRLLNNEIAHDAKHEKISEESEYTYSVRVCGDLTDIQTAVAHMRRFVQSLRRAHEREMLENVE